jgi:hypothetical protein
MEIAYENSEPSEMKAQDIPNGTTFTGQISCYQSNLFLCAGGEAKMIVSLDIPEHTWTVTKNLKIKNFKVVEISLIVCGKA